MVVVERSRFDPGQQTITLAEWRRRQVNPGEPPDDRDNESQEEADPLEELRQREGSQTRRWQDMTGEKPAG